MGMIRPARTPRKWSAKIESVAKQWAYHAVVQVSEKLNTQGYMESCNHAFESRNS